MHQDGRFECHKPDVLKKQTLQAKMILGQKNILGPKKSLIGETNFLGRHREFKLIKK